MKIWDLITWEKFFGGEGAVEILQTIEINSCILIRKGDIMNHPKSPNLKSAIPFFS